MTIPATLTTADDGTNTLTLLLMPETRRCPYCNAILARVPRCCDEAKTDYRVRSEAAALDRAEFDFDTGLRQPVSLGLDEPARIKGL